LKEIKAAQNPVYKKQQCCQSWNLWTTQLRLYEWPVMQNWTILGLL